MNLQKEIDTTCSAEVADIVEAAIRMVDRVEAAQRDRYTMLIEYDNLRHAVEFAMDDEDEDEGGDESPFKDEEERYLYESEAADSQRRFEKDNPHVYVRLE